MALVESFNLLVWDWLTQFGVNNYTIGLMKIFKQAKNLLVGTTEFYFYINGKIQDGGSEGGSVSSGAFGFIFPIAPASFGICKAIGDFYNIEIYPKYIMIMVIFILVCIYLFYRRNDKGNKIFRKYDNKKINTWYYILPLFFCNTGIIILAHYFTLLTAIMIPN